MEKFEDIFIDDTRNVERVSSKEYFKNGKIAIIDQGKELIIGYTDRKDCKVCEEERIIFGDHTRNFKYINIPFITGADGTKVLKLRDSNKYNYKYLYYYLLHSNIPNTGYNRHFKWVKELRFDIPELEEQIRVATKLDYVQDIIELRKKQIEELEQLIKARFVELFGDPEKNTLGWKEQPLSKHLNVIGGYAFKSEKFSEEGIPVLRIGNINSGFFKPVNLVFWEDDDELSRYKMHPGDLVMSLTGTVGKDDYGNVCILGNDYTEYYLNQRNAKLELKDTMNKYYLSMLLKFEPIKKKLTGISRGVRQANISNKDILNLSVPIPPIELQNQFATFVEQTDKSKLLIQKNLEEIQKLQDSLMSKYFG